jgi:hypothetical protein
MRAIVSYVLVRVSKFVTLRAQARTTFAEKTEFGISGVIRGKNVRECDVSLIKIFDAQEVHGHCTTVHS